MTTHPNTARVTAVAIMVEHSSWFVMRRKPNCRPEICSARDASTVSDAFDCGDDRSGYPIGLSSRKAIELKRRARIVMNKRAIRRHTWLNMFAVLGFGLALAGCSKADSPQFQSADTPYDHEHEHVHGPGIHHDHEHPGIDEYSPLASSHTSRERIIAQWSSNLRVASFDRRPAFHSGRTIGGDGHHRDSDRAVAASRPGSARSGRRMNCKSNLRSNRRGLAQLRNELPRVTPGYLYRSDPRGNSMGFGWGTMILPFLEEAAVYAEFDWRRGFVRSTQSNPARAPFADVSLSLRIRFRGTVFWRWASIQSSAMRWPATSPTSARRTSTRPRKSATASSAAIAARSWPTSRMVCRTHST